MDASIRSALIAVISAMSLCLHAKAMTASAVDVAGNRVIAVTLCPSDEVRPALIMYYRPWIDPLGNISGKWQLNLLAFWVEPGPGDISVIKSPGKDIIVHRSAMPVSTFAKFGGISAKAYGGIVEILNQEGIMFTCTRSKTLGFSYGEESWEIERKREGSVEFRSSKRLSISVSRMTNENIQTIELDHVIWRFSYDGNDLTGISGEGEDAVRFAYEYGALCEVRGKHTLRVSWATQDQDNRRFRLPARTGLSAVVDSVRPPS